MIVYPHISDYINKRRFPLHDIPDSYGMINEYFLDPSTCGPIRSSLYGETGYGNYTIADMIDMFNNEIPFTFSKKENVFEIYRYLFEYVELLEENKHSLDKFTLNYLERSKKFLEKVRVVASRLVRILNLKPKEQNKTLDTLVEEYNKYITPALQKRLTTNVSSSK